MEPKHEEELRQLPRVIRLGAALFGSLSLVVGLPLGAFVVIGMGMSLGHGGNPVPNVRELLVDLLPPLLTGMGIIGLACKTTKRLVAFSILLVLFIMDISILASL
jgi:hypothetical protein